MKMNKRITDR